MSLQGKRVALLIARNFQDEEVFEPKQSLEAYGVVVDLIAPAAGEYAGKYGRHTFTVTLTIGDADPDVYDALLIPGGAAPEQLRLIPEVLDFVIAFMINDMPVAAICHGPQVLISAGLLVGRRATSYIGIRDDVVQAGAEWLNEPVVVDRNLITSRTPEDIPFFVEELRRLLEAPPAPTFPPDLSPSGAVKMAIAGEIIAAAVYGRLASEAGNPKIAAKYSYLAMEERTHREQLERLYQRYTSQSFVLPEGFQPVENPEGNSQATPEDVLLKALELEGQAYEFYTAAALRSTWPETRAIFHKLASDERRHKDILEAELGLMGHNRREVTIGAPPSDGDDTW